MWDKNGIRIIGIDPGYSTGIVMIEIPDRILTHNTIEGKSPVRYILDLVLSFSNALIVIEKAPNDGDRTQSIRVDRIGDAIAIKGRQVNMIFPGEWKPFAKAQEWDYPTASSQHEKDAYCIAKYFAMFKVK